jgi:hypothetical protein
MLIPGTPFSDHDPLAEHRKRTGSALFDFLVRTAEITDELGEYAAAKTVEKGVKKKKLKESSLVESVDLIICSLSLFFANGGRFADLVKIGQEKLNKWEDRV